jgi:hypothetical protein
MFYKFSIQNGLKQGDVSSIQFSTLPYNLQLGRKMTDWKRKELYQFPVYEYVDNANLGVKIWLV